MIPKLLTGSIVVAMVLSATCGYGGTWASLSPTLAAAGVAQAPDARPSDRKSQAQDLLRRARQALAENDLGAAEALVAQAEGLGVEYSPFHFGDTPRKARHDLEERKAAAGPQQGNAPGKGPAPTDPFTARSQMAGAAQGPVRLPPVEQAAAVQGLKPGAATSTNPLARPPMSVPPTEAAMPLPTLGRQAPPPGAAAPTTPNHLLLGARKALAVGDVRRATGLVEQAKAMPANRGPYDDAPESVEAVIRRHNDLISVPADRKNTESYRREYARLLMEQAEGLARRGELDEAERLSHEALRQQVVFGPLEATPQALLQRIAMTRRPAMAGAPGAPGATSAVPGTLPPGTLPPGTLPPGTLPPGMPAGAAAMPAGEAFVQQGTVPAAQAAVVPAAGQAVVPAGAQMVVPAGGGPLPDQRATQAIYNPANDPTRNVPANHVPQSATTGPQAAGPLPAGQPQPMNVGMALIEQGEAALRARDHATAAKCFREAAQYRDQLDPISAQRLQDHLQLLSMTTPRAPSAVVDDAAAKQQLLAKQVLADVVHEESGARAIRESDPKKALAMLEQTRQKVEGSGLDPAARDQLLRRIDRSVTEMRTFIDQNRPKIELDEKNRRIKNDLARQEHAKVEVQEKVAMMVNDYNRLMDEQRYEEAQVLAKRAVELDPKNPVVHQILAESKLISRVTTGRMVQGQKEQGFVDAMVSVDKASIPFDDLNPYMHGDVKEWQRLTTSRAKAAAERGRRRSEREIEIEQKMKTPVSLQFENASLTSVLEYLGKYAQVNIHTDPQGLAEEGVTSDTPVTIKLQQEISLKSALNLILQPLHLNYVIKDEVLKITSEQLRSGEVYTVTYNVADLVVPIPNFMPSADAGLAGSYRNGVDVANRMGTLGPMGLANAPVAVVASREGGRGASAAINPAVLAQMPNGSSGAGAVPPPTGNGPGGLGGATQADFESLIDLITSTIKPTSWDTVGGPGSIAQFETNLSLVVSQTQDVHDDIVDLLEQLRKLQDLQVTIEVRFITLNDNFFERIGIDFDFDLNSNVDKPYQIFGNFNPNAQTQFNNSTTTNQGVARDLTDRNLKGSQSATVGLQAPGVFSADLDIPFRQGSYDLTTPTFGRFDPTAGATMGFAILSDIEAYFFMQAAQGDRRTNVLQAPKVTLFNGQQAFVSDTSQAPFVISVIPVVGDFAAALQPVIVVLSEGTFLTVQAVVSNDRRFVRLTVVPFFSKIGDVNTFTFEGKQTTTSNSSTEGNQETPNDNTKKVDDETVTTEGTTVQLPTFAFVTVTTTVSVPDGGTVLLGGIKRLSEERNEQGVPILNKIPYVNRLFQNVGIGRDTQSLMMMVTPRIIIQEEEESKLGIQP